MRPLALALTFGVLACGPSVPAPPTPAPIARAAPSFAPAPVASAAPSAHPAAPVASADKSADEPSPLPPGFVGIDGEGEVQCGAFKVTIQQEAPKAFRRFVRVTAADGRRVYEAHGRHFQYVDADLTLDFCGDLTGDGVPEIVMTESTMGAHCCYTRYVVSLTTPTKRLLMWEKGDAGTRILPVKYGSGADYQLEDRAVVWPPFDTEKGDPVLSYASAPLVPVVFALSGGQFKLMTLAFRQPFLEQRETVRAECAKDPTGCWGEIALWIDALALGDWPAAKAADVADADLRGALDRRASAMRKILEGLGTRGRPVDPTPR
jgi:hypothetical protein